MNIRQFSTYLEQLEGTASRTDKTNLLADMFANMDPEEAGRAVHLALGQLAPEYEGIEMNLAEKMVTRCLMQAYDEEKERVTELYNETGDLGAAAERLAEAKSTGKPLSIAEVYDALYEVAEYEGEGSQERKIHGFAALLRKLEPKSARYVTRIPLGKLRLGFSDLTVLDALSVMTAGDKSKRGEIERAYNVSADIGHIVETVCRDGVAGVRNTEITPGTPVRLSSAERLPSAEEVIEKLGEASAEGKLDGFRIQVHCWTDKRYSDNRPVRTFSRNLEDTTDTFPDLVKAAKQLDAESIVFDGEAVGYDPNTGEFLPFQETMQRKRKHGIEEAASEIPLKVFVFDVLYLNGEAIYKHPYTERRELVKRVFPGSDNTEASIIAARATRVASAKEIETLFDEYTAEGLEGLVVKKLDAPYEAGARGFHWIKFKRSQRGELADTIDAVVMGYYHGRGKRQEFGIGAFLIGVPDNNGRIRSLAKVGTGLTDEEWREMKRRCDKVRTATAPEQYDVDENVAPDYWCEPALVVEIEADEITESPTHRAAKEADNEHGLALRFPRLVRFRDDKDPGQATTESEVITLFKQQRDT